MRLSHFASAVFLTWFGMQMLVRADEPALTEAGPAALNSPQGGHVISTVRYSRRPSRTTRRQLPVWTYPCPAPAGATVAPAPVQEAEIPAVSVDVVPPKAFIDGTGPGWVTLTGDDFEKVNGDDDTWVWNGSHVVGTGKPIGVCKSKKQYTNFEWVAEWKHNESGGNSGFFAWTPPSVLENLPPGQLPKGGIEVQILDHGYVEKWEKSSGKKWEDGKSFFTTNGDIFAVGSSKMTPFEPLSPGGHRSFPRKNMSKGHGQWNHYYVRAINGELRLWVNGEEVSGGNNCEPRTGHLCLEQEGAPIEFRNIRVRELP